MGESATLPSVAWLAPRTHTGAPQHMWANLGLRNRILLSYTIILILVLALAGYLILQLRAITERTDLMQSTVSATVSTNTSLISDITNLRQAINAYLFAPSTAQDQLVRNVFSKLSADLRAARNDKTTTVEVNQIRSILPLLGAYEQDFQTLVSLLGRQSQEVATLKIALYQASDLLATDRNAFIAQTSDPTRTAERLALAESNLRRVSLWTISDQGSTDPAELRSAAGLAQQTNAELTPLLEELRTPDLRARLGRISTLINQSAIGMQSYASNIELRQKYETNLRAKDERLQIESDGLARGAEQLLIESTAALTAQSAAAQRLALGAFVSVLVLAVLIAIGLAQTITRPLKQVVDAIEGMYHGRSAIRIATSDRSEVGQLAHAFNDMVDALSAERLALQSQQETLTERNAELEGALSAVHAAQAERDMMAGFIRNVSVPILPILDRVVLVPLVGELDQERAMTMADRVLRGVEDYRARLIILDVTGVPLIDSAVAQWLIRVIESARLLGADCTMVGITPEVAQTLVSTGIDLSMINTQADLRTAIEHVVRDRSRSLGRMS
jgi:rsbT co-antagonist protein RsbR